MSTSPEKTTKAKAMVEEMPRDLPMPNYEYQNDEFSSFSLSSEPEDTNTAGEAGKVLQNVILKF